MKSRFYIIVGFGICAIALFSCGNGSPSKNEAKKQIDAYLSEHPIKTELSTLVAFSDYPENPYAKQLKNAQTQGFIDFHVTSHTEYSDHKHFQDEVVINIHDKIKPFILSKKAQQAGSMFYDVFMIKGGNYESEIVSIESIPDASGMGKILCNVSYKYKCVLNELGNIFEMKSTGNNGQIKSTKLIRRQEGWRLDETNLNDNN